MVNSLNNLSRKAFYEMPLRPWNEIIECNSFVLLPQGTALHDSGYRYMDAVACMYDKALCRVSGGSDMFMLSQASDIFTKERTPTHASSWGIDCLKRSGLFRVYMLDGLMQIECALSSLYIHPLTASVKFNA